MTYRTKILSDINTSKMLSQLYREFDFKIPLYFRDGSMMISEAACSMGKKEVLTS